MNPLQHAYEATFEELLQLAYALAPEGGFILTACNTVRRPAPEAGYSARACPLCASFNTVFDVKGAQYPAGQLERQVQKDGLRDPDFRYHGSVELHRSGTVAEGWHQFISAADGVDLDTEEGRARRELMVEVLCKS